MLFGYTWTWKFANSNNNKGRNKCSFNYPNNIHTWKNNEQLVVLWMHWMKNIACMKTEHQTLYSFTASKTSINLWVEWAFFPSVHLPFICLFYFLFVYPLPFRPMHASAMVELSFNPFFFRFVFHFSNNSNKEAEALFDVDDSKPSISNATAKHPTKTTNNGTTNDNQTQTVDKLLFEKMSLHHNSFNIETMALLFMFAICAIIYSSKCSILFAIFFPSHFERRWNIERMQWNPSGGWADWVGFKIPFWFLDEYRSKVAKSVWVLRGLRADEIHSKSFLRCMLLFWKCARNSVAGRMNIYMILLLFFWEINLFFAELKVVEIAYYTSGFVFNWN